MDVAVLYVTLGAALVSFVASTYTTLRTLLPLLPGHPLNRRSVDAPEADKRPRLKSAQRFTAYLSLVDIAAATILITEVAIAVSTSRQLGGSRGAASRVYLATTARPTLLLVVALLSYANVAQGRSITLGRADCIVWLPALSVYALGAGLASVSAINSPNVWIGLAIWLSVVTACVTLCFGRLLLAILRVRRLTQRENALSRFAQQQATSHLPYSTTLPNFRHNFSGLSTSFVNSIGRSASSLSLPSQGDILPFTSDSRPAVVYAASRASTEELDFDQLREFRSPTPGSAHLLLDRSTTSTPASFLSGRLTPRLGPRLPGVEPDHDVIEVEGDRFGIARSRASFSSITSRASTYLAPGGFVGGAQVRNALLKEAWGAQTPPGTGHSPPVELSSNEARGALVRIGGHLVCSLLTYALVSPFVFSRLLHPGWTPPLATTVLLVLGVCQPSLILAWQCWASEGFWFRRPAPPVLTSSSALAIEQLEGVYVECHAEAEEKAQRSESRASTARTWRTSLPGISPDGEDCSSTQRSKIGRAMSMLSMHPKLQLLSSDVPLEISSTTSGFVKSASTGHARLRSLKLSKATVGSFGEMTRADLERAASAGQGAHPVCESAPVPTASPLDHFAFATRELSLSPSSSTFPSAPANPSTTPPAPPADHTIDYLSAHILPQLVPSIKLGENVKVGPKDAPFARRRSTIDAPMSLPSRTGRSLAAFATGSLPSRRPRNHRGLSLPGLVSSASMAETWVAVDELGVPKSRREDEDGAGNPVAVSSPGITQILRDGTTSTLRDDSPRSAGGLTSRSAREWDEVEAAAKSVEAAVNARATPSIGAVERAGGSHERASSSGTQLDISFEWEYGATELLDENGGGGQDNLANVGRSHSSTRVPPSPLALRSATSAACSRPVSADGRLVLQGSQYGADDEADALTGTIHCATLRPVSRNSDFATLDLHSPTLPRAPHAVARSLSSARSLTLTATSSLASEGFHNMMSNDVVRASPQTTAASARAPFQPIPSNLAITHFRY
ncbi:uncharacterized protein JCM10292_004492 [Rhodotorula paludigena]|uniref:uncharacterized protein n=1 Tax=Rhodotorula paludigena TaxID=86838 RepID=UPI00317C9981